GIHAAGLDFGRIRIGDSISVQGVCLTVVEREDQRFEADVSRETLLRTTLSRLGPGDPVNLEPALRAGDALGGHLVSGHVDGIGRLVSMHADARSRRMEFELPKELMRFVAAKGSICLDGVSLTVNSVQERRFDVNIIPHTLAVTSLGSRGVDDQVNVEIDLIARYLDRLLPKN
ncbi:MAG: riboflavin synthase, partial [Proteobacteria bacterium]|nr:riboflavin synthase [Pseudomonadota bacterium]